MRVPESGATAASPPCSLQHSAADRRKLVLGGPKPHYCTVTTKKKKKEKKRRKCLSSVQSTMKLLSKDTTPLRCWTRASHSPRSLEWCLNTLPPSRNHHKLMIAAGRCESGVRGAGGGRGRGVKNTIRIPRHVYTHHSTFSPPLFFFFTSAPVDNDGVKKKKKNKKTEWVTENCCLGRANVTIHVQQMTYRKDGISHPAFKRAELGPITAK